MEKRRNAIFKGAPPLATQSMLSSTGLKSRSSQIAPVDSRARRNALKMEAAPDAMVVVNQAGKIVLLNVQAEKQCGHRCDELLGQKVTDILPAGFAGRLLADDLRDVCGKPGLAQVFERSIDTTKRFSALQRHIVFDTCTSSIASAQRSA